MFFGKKKKEKAVDHNVYRFVEGNVIGLETVADPVFAQKMMGDGAAIIPTDKVVLAPVSGVVSVVFPTGHAYGITRDDGVEILIHLGIDTVELDGKGFESKVSQGDTVSKGDVLAHVDWNLISSEGKEISSMIIVTSGQEIELTDGSSDVLFTVK